VDFDRIAGACTVWGDLINRPVCGFIQSGEKREANNSRPELPYRQSQTALKYAVKDEIEEATIVAGPQGRQKVLNLAAGGKWA
jgi:hypothetical protein